MTMLRSTMIYDQPLAIDRGELERMLASPVSQPAAAAAAMGDRTQEERQFRVVSFAPHLALVPITGELIHRPQWYSWGMTYSRVKGPIIQAMACSDIRGIILDINSPGGQVNGLLDLTDFIHMAGTIKPIYAMIDEIAFSAAYTLASAAKIIIMPRTGKAGSIGVISAHVDTSKMDEADGLKYTFLTGGRQKNDGNYHFPLSPSARERIQHEVDRLYLLVSQTVAKYRHLTVDAVMAQEAGIFCGPEAVSQGLVDKILSRDEAMMEFSADANSFANSLTQQEETMTQEAVNAAIGQPTPQPQPVATQPTQTALPTAQPVPVAPQPAPLAQPVPVAPQPAPLAQPVPVAPQPAPTAYQTAMEQVQKYVSEVHTICALARKSERATEFIQRQLSIEQVRDSLLQAQAQEDAALAISTSGSVAPQGGGSLPVPPPLDAAKLFAHRQAVREKAAASDMALYDNP